MCAVVLAVALVSCGRSGDGDISAEARAQLEPMVANIRRAAEASDRDGAARALADVRQTVAGLHARRLVDDERTRAILTAAARVEEQLSLVPTTTTSPAVTAPTAPTTPTAPPTARAAR
jgi:hypothetical protein